MTTVAVHSDPERLPMAVLGTETEFTAWVRPHWPALRSLAARLAPPGEHDDVLQEAVERAWRKRGTFDPARGTPAAWLLAIVADRARRSRMRRRPTTDPLITVPVADRTPDVDLAAALDKLADRQRLAVELHYYLGLPVAEVAAAMGCAEGTVKATLSAARGRLRTMLEEDT